MFFFTSSNIAKRWRLHFTKPVATSAPIHQQSGSAIVFDSKSVNQCQFESSRKRCKSGWVNFSCSRIIQLLNFVWLWNRWWWERLHSVQSSSNNSSVYQQTSAVSSIATSSTIASSVTTDFTSSTIAKRYWLPVTTSRQTTQSTDTWST